ncbi:hypothetical protein VTN00DRAFT_6906 [Thermoascus crustaceus]|uniref:uncharacterized protein n=1 Tax=Thermoascus crustaceus TaxID=5088 RepID=UPI003741EF8A
MSGVRGFVPAAVAAAVGVLTGYYTFQPAFQHLEAEKRAGVQAITKPPPQPQSSTASNNNDNRPTDSSDNQTERK